MAECALYDLIVVYYKRLFPHSELYRWLSYGDPVKFSKREISFTLIDDVYIRNQSFDTIDAFSKHAFKRRPLKIDIGAIYDTKPIEKTKDSQITPVEKELIFDIDVSDYDDVRNCCTGPNICTKCWKFMVIACKILEHSMKDFDFNHRLWVFSGRRGIHCWVCDENARNLNVDVRQSIAGYFQVVKGGTLTKRVILDGNKLLHPLLKEAIKIIDEHFPSIVEEQDILGTHERFQYFMDLIEPELKIHFETEMEFDGSSLDKWNAFNRIFSNLSGEDHLPKERRYLKQEIMLHYCCLRLDVNVTTGLNHLLKCPFSVHPKTGRVAVPFDPEKVDQFNPCSVPKAEELLNEIDRYGMEKGADAAKVRDVKKTSLWQPYKVFERFVKKLEVSRQLSQQ